MIGGISCPHDTGLEKSLKYLQCLHRLFAHRTVLLIEIDLISEDRTRNQLTDYFSVEQLCCLILLL